MIQSYFNKKTGVLETTFSGDLIIEEVVEYVKKNNSNEDYPRFLKILTDTTTARMQFGTKDLSKIIEQIYKSVEVYDFVIDALVVDSAMETAIAQFYENLDKPDRYRFKVFSTFESANERHE
jgi:hypothetical protein